MLLEEKTEQAESALESLLSMGPNNTAALKLKAKLYEYRGDFEGELSVWKKIHSIDNEDREAYHFFQLRQIEEFEHQHFTDILSDGSLRMLTYQKPLMWPMVGGLVGSLTFVIFTNYAQIKANALLDPRLLIALFALTVVMPFMLVTYKFFTTTYFYALDKEKFTVSTRLSERFLYWRDLEGVYLERDGGLNHAALTLVLKPKDPLVQPITVDMTPKTTCIRSRQSFLREFAYFFSKPRLTEKDHPS